MNFQPPREKRELGGEFSAGRYDIRARGSHQLNGSRPSLNSEEFGWGDGCKKARNHSEGRRAGRQNWD